MKIKLSKSQWELVGKKAGWMKKAQANSVFDPQILVDLIQQLNKMKEDFKSRSAKIPQDKWTVIGKDCDAVYNYLDNASGRISTIINRVKQPQTNPQAAPMSPPAQPQQPQQQQPVQGQPI